MYIVAWIILTVLIGLWFIVDDCKVNPKKTRTDCMVAIVAALIASATLSGMFTVMIWLATTFTVAFFGISGLVLIILAVRRIQQIKKEKKNK